MTIEIHRPELEALISQHMASGQFRSVEDLLLRMFEALPAVQEPAGANPRKQSMTQFLKASPLWGSGLTVERSKDEPRRVEL